MSEKTMTQVGWEEWVNLPDLDLPAIKAKVDTGAKTSALHAFSIEYFGRADRRRVRFGIHPIVDRPDIEVYCTADLKDHREVISSNGERELRPIIESTLSVGGEEWPIEISLTNREGMANRMLLGRTAMRGHLMVVPTESFLLPELSADAYSKRHRSTRASRSLKIGILSREPDSYSTKRLVEAAEARDHMVEVINTLRCYMSVTAHRPRIFCEGEPLDGFDAIIPRIGASITSYGLAVVRQFESMGVYCLNGSAAIAASRDKLFAHQLLARNNISMPVTGFAHSVDDTKDVIKIVNGAPLVLKLLEGTQGRGVVLAETTKAAESAFMAFRGLKADLLVQEFVKEAGGMDIRCFVIGGKVVGAMKRQAPEGEFRSNLHRGGSASSVRITKEERQAAIKAARTIGLRVAGVDLLRSSEGPKVLEVNSSPGLQGIEASSGKDLAGTIMEHLETRLLPPLEAPAKQAQK